MKPKNFNLRAFPCHSVKCHFDVTKLRRGRRILHVQLKKKNKLHTRFFCLFGEYIFSFASLTSCFLDLAVCYSAIITVMQRR